MAVVARTGMHREPEWPLHQDLQHVLVLVLGVVVRVVAVAIIMRVMVLHHCCCLPCMLP